MANRWGRRASFVLAVPALLIAFSLPAQAQDYVFTRMADSVENRFSPFGFGCSSINNRGAVGFKADRVRAGTLVPGIYRVNPGGHLTTIAQDRGRFDFIESNPSMNDGGEVSFLARLGAAGNFELEVLRGNGRRLKTIASTADRFSQFGSYNSVNNDGVVAFKAQLDNFDEGLFSASNRGPRNLTVHYLASNSPFSAFGSRSRPSINNLGEVAFEEQVDDVFASGIFVTHEGSLETVAPPDPEVSVDRPTLNDAGTAAFHRSFIDDGTGEFVEELVTGSGGTLTTIADTTGPFQAFGFWFGFQAPALNNEGGVAFGADLDSPVSPPPNGIFVGPDPVSDRVIETGDTLGGLTVEDLLFCEEGLNDSGQLSFVATFDDPSTPEGVREAVYRATPRP